MKKTVLTFLCFIITFQEVFCCGWYSAEYEYFNLFTQEIIKDKSYLPLLFIRYDGLNWVDENGIPDENIKEWQSYFDNKLTYKQVYNLVYKTDVFELHHFKKNIEPFHLISNFYKKYSEEIDYLITAKGLEFDSYEARNKGYDASIVKKLDSLYHSTKSRKLKLRYGYLIVRYNRYTNIPQKTIFAFEKYIVPLRLKTAIYYFALNQYAGAQKKIGLKEDACYNFFTVFCNSNKNRGSAYLSMKFTGESFQNLLTKVKTDQEKVMAYFLLAHQNYNNPLPIMEKIYEINPKSEVLKVLSARAINQLEGEFLSVDNYAHNDYWKKRSEKEFLKQSSKKEIQPKKELSFFSKIWMFFEGVFEGNKENSFHKKLNSVQQSDVDKFTDSLTNRFPTIHNKFATKPYADKIKKHLLKLQVFFQESVQKDRDEFWKISEAYLEFLQKNYGKSQEILNSINTKNSDYLEQINSMSMLNDILMKPFIDADFEEHLMKKYGRIFTTKKIDEQYYPIDPSVENFIRITLANRYLLQGEDGKSFILTNHLKELIEAPNYKIASGIKKLYEKKNRTAFEENLFQKTEREIKTMAINNDVLSLVNLVIGDCQMRRGNFSEAQQNYANVKNVIAGRWRWNSSSSKFVLQPYPKGTYDRFNNISSKVFAYWNHSMEDEPFFKEFPFAKKEKMDKKQLADIVVRLNKIGQGNDERASKANQLIGNLLVNTLKIGVNRHLFTLDINNRRCRKFRYHPKIKTEFYKNGDRYSQEYIFIDELDYTIPLKYLEKALNKTKNRERKPKILFQMATVEKAMFLQWQSEQPKVDYSRNYKAYILEEKERGKKISAYRRKNFNTSFNRIHKDFSDTKTYSNLEWCSDFSDFF